MAPAASVAISLSFRFLPPRPYRGRVSVPRPIRALSDTYGVASGERKVGTLERRVGDLRAFVASVPPAVVSIRKNIGLNFVAGFCFGIAFLAVVARQIIIRTREYDNRGSVADLVRRGQLKSRQRGMWGPPLQQRSCTYQWKRPTVFPKEGDYLPPDVDPDTVRWIPVNHPFAAASSEVDEETAKQNVYQKDGVPSRVKAEHEALQTRLEASNDVTKFPSGPRNMQRSERSLRLPGESSGNLQHSESDIVKNQNGQPIF